jgi:hypothetical protein
VGPVRMQSSRACRSSRSETTGVLPKRPVAKSPLLALTYCYRQGFFGSLCWVSPTDTLGWQTVRRRDPRKLKRGYEQFIIHRSQSVYPLGLTKKTDEKKPQDLCCVWLHDDDMRPENSRTVN